MQSTTEDHDASISELAQLMLSGVRLQRSFQMSQWAALDAELEVFRIRRGEALLRRRIDVEASYSNPQSSVQKEEASQELR